MSRLQELEHQLVISVGVKDNMYTKLRCGLIQTWQWIRIYNRVEGIKKELELEKAKSL